LGKFVKQEEDILHPKKIIRKWPSLEGKTLVGNYLLASQFVFSLL